MYSEHHQSLIFDNNSNALYKVPSGPILKSTTGVTANLRAQTLYGRFLRGLIQIIYNTFENIDYLLWIPGFYIPELYVPDKYGFQIFAFRRFTVRTNTFWRNTVRINTFRANTVFKFLIPAIYVSDKYVPPIYFPELHGLPNMKVM